MQLMDDIYGPAKKVETCPHLKQKLNKIDVCINKNDCWKIKRLPIRFGVAY